MKLRRHEFGADYLLDCVVRLTEIVRRYEFLTMHLIEQPGSVAYVYGGPESSRTYIRRIETTILQEAITLANGNHTEAAKLVGAPHLIAFQRMLMRVGLKAKYLPREHV